MDCIFCKIINNEISSYKLYEDEVVIAFLDVNPDSNGHTLIIPKKHFKDINDIDNNTLTHIIDISRKLMIKLTEKLGCEGFTYVQNNGVVQEVKHFHIHLKPVYTTEENLILDNIENIFNKLK